MYHHYTLSDGTFDYIQLILDILTLASLVISVITLLIASKFKKLLKSVDNISRNNLGYANSIKELEKISAKLNIEDDDSFVSTNIVKSIVEYLKILKKCPSLDIEEQYKYFNKIDKISNSQCHGQLNPIFIKWTNYSQTFNLNNQIEV